MQFACPHCNAVCEADSRDQGKQMSCHACREVLQVPMAVGQPLTGPTTPGVPAEAGMTFTMKAVLTAALYWFAYLPGLIANIAFLVEASSARRRTGVRPEGMGCLWALLIVCFLAPAAIGLIGGMIAFVIWVVGR